MGFVAQSVPRAGSCWVQPGCEVQDCVRAPLCVHHCMRAGLCACTAVCVHRAPLPMPGDTEALCTPGPFAAAMSRRAMAGTVPRSSGTHPRGRTSSPQPHPRRTRGAVASPRDTPLRQVTSEPGPRALVPPRVGSGSAPRARAQPTRGEPQAPASGTAQGQQQLHPPPKTISAPPHRGCSVAATYLEATSRYLVLRMQVGAHTRARPSEPSGGAVRVSPQQLLSLQERGRGSGPCVGIAANGGGRGRAWHL